jgi:hypothetical protein
MKLTMSLDFIPLFSCCKSKLAGRLSVGRLQIAMDNAMLVRMTAHGAGSPKSGPTNGRRDAIPVEKPLTFWLRE